MTTDWAIKYIESREWEKQINLVNGDNGTKVCMCCEERKYTVDFPDADEFEDHKLPVCTACYKRQDGAGRKIVAEYPELRMCDDCDWQKRLDEFAYRKNGNKLHHTCRECVGTYEYEQ